MSFELSIPIAVSEQAFRPSHYINRELSWLEFNRRVLEEAQDPATPLLERVKFLSIFSSNLDEFFMVRVAGLREQAFASETPQDYNPDGMKALGQLREIALVTQKLVADQYACWAKDVQPALASEGISVIPLRDVKSKSNLKQYFYQTIYPIITPMAIDPSHPRPRYHNRSLYIGVMLRRRSGIGPKHLLAVVQIPHILPRLVQVRPDEATFVYIEDIITDHLPELFGGHEIVTHAPFRITRDSDLDVIEQESDDMLRMIEERLKERRRADAVRLEVDAKADPALIQMIVEQEELRYADLERPGAYNEVYQIPTPLDFTGLSSIYALDDFERLRDQPFVPRLSQGLRRHGEDLYSAIARRDILLHHPYEDFGPVCEFIMKAAQDPNVLAIKQTLYRTSGDSPIVKALSEAAEAGKHVTALVELQARFDEEANVEWARHLERSGAHVVYGFLDLKTHCKVSLVVRQEGDTLRRYVHLSTGNYNPATARSYTDMGLFTADEDFATDASALFNLLTGYSQGYEWRKLIVAPSDLHRRTIELITEQAELARAGKPSRITAKLNSLVDHRVIDALYHASQAGVPIQLIVRGICCLRPGIEGISENIEVISIVDRFLEHSRIFVFGVDADAKVYLSSADWMPRNFYRRVEVMFPIESVGLRKRLLQDIIPIYLRDNVRARRLRPDGTYKRVKPKRGESPFRSQHEFLSAESILRPRPVAVGNNGVPADTSKKKARKKEQRK